MATGDAKHRFAFAIFQERREKTDLNAQQNVCFYVGVYILLKMSKEQGLSRSRIFQHVVCLCKSNSWIILTTDVA